MSPWLDSWWPFAPWLLPYTLAVSLAAGFVRGYTGFGYSVLVVCLLSPFVAPGPLVAAVLMLEVVGSLVHLPGMRSHVDRTWFRSLLVGNLVAVPLGVAALAWMPLTSLRLLVGGSLLTAALLLRGSAGRVLPANPMVRGVAAVSSGLLNGLAASGGIVAALMMAATRPLPERLRATMIVWLLFIGLYVLAWAALIPLLHSGPGMTALLGWDALRWVVVLWPTMAIGLNLGRRRFRLASAAQFRRVVLDLLVGTSALSLMLALWGAWRAG